MAVVVDKYILTEALSAILGVTVKLQSDCKDLNGAIQLHITSLTTLALLGYDAFMLVVQPVSYITSLLTGWFIGDQKNSQETPKNESASSSLRKELFVIPDDFFDQKFDFDFTNMSESKSDECMRGDEPYKRPYGWMRFALKVRDKYPDGNAWLGTGGWRSRSAPGEWPVSYHGTDLQGAAGIIQTQYTAGDRQAYGRGIYSSPDINVADVFAKTKNFISQKKSSCRTESTPRRGKSRTRTSGWSLSLKAHQLRKRKKSWKIQSVLTASCLKRCKANSRPCWAI
ncbi:uncharacterized protein LOC127501364 [Ctenopharyngodon idella]|uniref:uncharacterized protein LOC127501364 n=1 Tax=Ctenopharyngodon idella TaxID=7959 RepID=UPI00222E718C|nr:uncharacterized protein LOC127501364 [Ctenopharyngodon idella]